MAGRLEPSLSLAAEGDFDLAMLDVNLAGELSFPIADVLGKRGIPYLFATGYGIKGVEEAYRSAPVLQKPFRAIELAQALRDIAP